jgi:hypothetical protein
MFLKKKEIITLIVITLIASFIRLYSFSEWSIDIDEAFTPWESEKTDFMSFIDYFTFENQTLLKNTTLNRLELTQTFLIKIHPLYYFLNHQILKIYGISEFSLRILSVTFGILAVWLIFLLGRAFLNYKMSVVLVLFTIFHPLIHFHSQNARFYSMIYFVSLIIIYSSLKIRESILSEQVSTAINIKFFVFGIFICLAMLIHASIIFSYTFILIVFLDVILQKGTTKFLRRSIYIWIPLLIMGFFVFVNQIIFLRGRLGNEIIGRDLLQVGGSHLFYNITSLIFNFGIYFWMIIPLGIWLLLKDDNRIFKIFMITFILNILIYLFLSLKSYQIRFDYFYPVLPIFLIIITFTLSKSVDIYVKEIVPVKVISFYAITVFLIGLMLPSFISNFLIDGDRLNWKEVTNYIYRYSLENKDKSIEIYSTDPENLNFYSKNIAKNIENKRLREMNIKLINDYKDTFIVVPLKRSGFDLRNIPKEIQIFLFKKGKMVKVIGKDRLDVHINKLMIFKLNTSEH